MGIKFKNMDLKKLMVKQNQFKNKISRIHFGLMCWILIACFFCGCNQTVTVQQNPNKRLYLSDNEEFRSVLRKNAEDAVRFLINEIETFPQSNGKPIAVTTVMLEDESWKRENGSWSRLSEEYYLIFKYTLKLFFGKRLIEPYSSFDDKSVECQMGQCKTVTPEKFTPGDILIRISLRCDNIGLNFFATAKKFNSPIEISCNHKGIDYEGVDNGQLLRNIAKKWEKEEPLYDIPAYPGSMEMPFKTVGQTSQFLAKVICSAFLNINSEQKNIKKQRVLVALNSDSQAPVELGNQVVKTVSTKLQRSCPEIKQVLVSEGYIKSVRKLMQLYQSGLFQQPENASFNLGEPNLKTPNILLLVSVNYTRSPLIYHVKSNAVWLDNIKHGEVINELSSEAFFKTKHYYVDINLQTTSRGLSGIWVKPVTNGFGSANIIVTELIIKTYPSKESMIWLPDRLGNSGYNSIMVKKPTNLLKKLGKPPVEGNGTVTISYRIQNRPLIPVRSVTLIYSQEK